MDHEDVSVSLSKRKRERDSEEEEPENEEQYDVINSVTFLPKSLDANQNPLHVDETKILNKVREKIKNREQERRQKAHLPALVNIPLEAHMALVNSNSVFVLNQAHVAKLLSSRNVQVLEDSSKILNTESFADFVNGHKSFVNLELDLSVAEIWEENSVNNKLFKISIADQLLKDIPNATKEDRDRLLVAIKESVLLRYQSDLPASIFLSTNMGQSTMEMIPADSNPSSFKYPFQDEANSCDLETLCQNLSLNQNALVAPLEGYARLCQFSATNNEENMANLSLVSTTEFSTESYIKKYTVATPYDLLMGCTKIALNPNKDAYEVGNAGQQTEENNDQKNHSSSGIWYIIPEHLALAGFIKKACAEANAKFFGGFDNMYEMGKSICVPERHVHIILHQLAKNYLRKAPVQRLDSLFLGFSMGQSPDLDQERIDRENIESLRDRTFHLSLTLAVEWFDWMNFQRRESRPLLACHDLKAENIYYHGDFFDLFTNTKIPQTEVDSASINEREENLLMMKVKLEKQYLKKTNMTYNHIENLPYSNSQYYRDLYQALFNGESVNNESWDESVTAVHINRQNGKNKYRKINE